jgi:hypothetical protein
MGMRVSGLLMATFVVIAGCSSDDPPGPAATVTRTAAAATATSAPATETAVAPTETAPPATETAPPATGTPTTVETPPNVSARRISSEEDLPRGPLAHGRIGDYLLENDVARFVIQDAPRRDLYSVGAFGGNLIDAELRSNPGLENFLEIQPAVNIETVINAQTVEIVNDGADGLAAVIRACGPDDILDFVNGSTVVEGAGLPFPASADDVDHDIEGCTEYALEPDRPYVRMVTTIFNNEESALGLFVGDYINGAGELDQWASSEAGLGEILTGSFGVLSYIGIGDAAGADYALVPIPVEGSPIPGSSFFTASGVSYLMHSHSVLQVIFGMPPTFIVPAGGSRSFTRYFAVGDGSGSSAIDVQNEVRGLDTGTLRGCVTIGGRPAPGARVAVGPAFEGRFGALSTIFTTGGDGCYEGTLRPGTYGVAGNRDGAPFEGGGPTPGVHEVTIAAGATVAQDIALPDSGRLRVTARDGGGAPLPARISVIGFDPSPEPILASPPIPGLGFTNTGLFNDITKDRLPSGFVSLVYAGADGLADFEVEPGTYQVFVSRGAEYSLVSQTITVEPGETTAIEARIAAVVDTPGFVSSDFHVHGINSADSRVSHRNRIFQFAGEGVDNAIMTDHHAHTDLGPMIEELGLEAFLRATVGEEITTWDYGHLNAYPLLIDPTRPSGGSTDWAGEAPAGRDFVHYGAFSLTPAEIAALATEGPTSTPDTTIQINHIDSFFDPMRIDTALVPPRSFLSPEGRRRFRLDPDGGELFHHYPALELWNGAGRRAQELFLVERIGVWMNHLNQGLRTTAIADTDTHQFTNLETAGARSWTASPTDAPAEIDPADVARAVDAGRLVGGQGVYVQTRLVAADESGATADLTLAGSTTVRSEGGVDLEIHAQAPVWAPYDRIEIFANAETVVARSNDGVPTMYGAEPTLVLHAGVDFEVERIVVDPEVPGAERFETHLTVPFRELIADTWFVVVVRGTDGVSPPAFPVFAQDLSRESNTTLEDLVDGNLGEGGVLAMGFANALYADVDGTEGFDPPRRPLEP